MKIYLTALAQVYQLGYNPHVWTFRLITNTFICGLIALIVFLLVKQVYQKEE